MYLSEYDIEDRIILYSEDICSGSGVKIVPMTVSQLGYNSEWIIAASSTSSDKDLHYWVIKNDYENEPTVDEIKRNVLGLLDIKTFEKTLDKEGIHISLKGID